MRQTVFPLVMLSSHPIPAIPPTVLAQYEARLQRFGKKAPIFSEGQEAVCFFQLESGLVKMTNYSANRDRTQKFFFPGESFGEPPLLNQFAYPAAAVAVAESEVWMLNRADFFELLNQNPEAHLGLTRHLCNRLLYKNMLLRSATEHGPNERVMLLLRFYQRQLKRPGDFLVPFTRQEMADMLGLRVETVIRACLALCKQGKLKRVDRKLVLPQETEQL